MPYKRLTNQERETISQMLAKDESLPSVARFFNRAVSTISREIARNSPSLGSFSSFTAEEKARQKAGTRHRQSKITGNAVLESVIIEKLHLHWSPKQIAWYLKQTYKGRPAMQASHETIYTYIYVKAKKTLRQELLLYLRLHRKRRLKRGTAKDRRGVIPDMISIDERPASVEERTIPGHWEGDLIIGKDHKSAMGTLVERTTRFAILVPLKAYDATSVRRAYAREIKKLPEQLRLSLTVDHGIENAQHRLFTEETKMMVYFAHPYSPWQRGTNENTNRLVRDFFPKGTDFRDVSAKEIKQVQKFLNERPRETLNLNTPGDMFYSLIYNLMSSSPVAL
jgi:IS30 family transposase